VLPTVWRSFLAIGANDDESMADNNEAEVAVRGSST
jgi:hypothetical protein